MRDAGKVRTKLDLKLDSNQVFFLFAALSVYSALIFVLGIVVGRARGTDNAPATVASLALPETTPTIKRMEERLAAAQPSATEEPELPIGDVMSHLENATPVIAVTPTPKATPRVPVKELVNATPVASATTPAVAAATPKEPREKETPAAVVVSSPRSIGAFTLQVVAYNDSKQADAEVAQLKSHGLEAYAVQSSIPGKGTVHRVRVGRYATRLAAETAVRDITAAEPNARPMVVQYE